MVRWLEPVQRPRARTSALVLSASLFAGSFAIGACTGDPATPTPTRDAGAPVVDARKPDSAVDGASDTIMDSSLSATDADPDAESDTRDSAPVIPNPVEDTGPSADAGPPAPGYRVDGVIGPAGGTLAGADGTALRGVRLVVPAGALTTDVHLAIDLQGTPLPPPGLSTISPYVAVGPDGVVFAVPARLTLPWISNASSPQLAMGARIGLGWSAMLDPIGDVVGRTLTASMKRTSGAAVVLVDLSMSAPTITTFSPTKAPAGTLVFAEGSKFGFAPIYRPGSDGGLDFTSTVKVGETLVSPLAWDDATISFRAPAGDGGVIRLTTPGGVAVSSAPLSP